MSVFEIRQGDVLERLREMPDESVHCVVTSPPYFGLRDYGTAVWSGGLPDCDHLMLRGTQGQSGQRADRSHTQRVPYKDLCGRCNATRADSQIGLEATPELFIAKLTEVFREVRRVLRSDGTCWVNIGDSYANDGKWGGSSGGKHVAELHGNTGIGRQRVATGLKPKCLIGIPWMLAFALRADGWFLRSEIIWHKVNPMPESVKDRPTKAHEQIFLFAKSEKYFYDPDAIKEKGSPDTHARNARGRSDDHKFANGGPGNQSIAKSFEAMRRKSNWSEPGVNPKCAEPGSGIKQNSSFSAAVKDVVEFRNKRSVWPMASMATPDAHFATFPIELPETCILAGCPVDGLVLDPFAGAGTTGLAALKNGRRFLGIELSAEYIAIAHRRAERHYPLLVGIA